MPTSLANRVKVGTATTGTGDLVLGAALPTYFGIERLTDGQAYDYEITDGIDSEVGTGTWNAGTSTLTRGCFESTKSDAVLNLSGHATVIITILAQTLTNLPNAPLAAHVASDNPHIYLGHNRRQFVYPSGGDDTAAVQAAIDAAAAQGGGEIWPAEAPFVFSGTGLKLKSNVEIYTPRGSVPFQFSGSSLFYADDDLTECVVDGIQLDYVGSTTTPYTVGFALKGHNNCRFANMDFQNFDNLTCLERIVSSAATKNTIDNIYENWNIGNCSIIEVGIGHEAYGGIFIADGSTTVFTCAQVWPEQFNSSVIVFVSDPNRVISEKLLHTDYSVSYPGGLACITFGVAPAAGSRVYIWPSIPIAAGRRPISNDEWRNIRTNNIYLYAHALWRWVDAQTYRFGRWTLSGLGSKGLFTNPAATRTNQAGDFFQIDGTVITYKTPDSSTIVGLDLGPGTDASIGDDVRFDSAWNDTGPYNAIHARDATFLQIPGTVSVTNGSPIVTGSGTKFRDWLSMVCGNNTDADGVRIGGSGVTGFISGINSIDSDTQITLSQNSTITASGLEIERWNKEQGVNYRITAAKSGYGYLSRCTKQVANFVFNDSGIDFGPATIPAGQTSVTVPYSTRRNPLPGEIKLQSHAALSGKTFSVGAIGATSFVINMSGGAAGSDALIGWTIELIGP